MGAVSGAEVVAAMNLHFVVLEAEIFRDNTRFCPFAGLGRVCFILNGNRIPNSKSREGTR